MKRTLLLCTALLLAGCGEDEPPAPAALAPGMTTTGALLEALASRVARGEGISDATWTRDVQEVGAALWPDDADSAHLAARRDHTNLAHIAGDMAAALADDGLGAREDWLARDPGSVRIHDAFVTASAGGPDAYRAWVTGAGRALLAERVAALQSERPPR